MLFFVGVCCSVSPLGSESEESNTGFAYFLGCLIERACCSVLLCVCVAVCRIVLQCVIVELRVQNNKSTFCLAVQKGAKVTNSTHK